MKRIHMKRIHLACVVVLSGFLILGCAKQQIQLMKEPVKESISVSGTKQGIYQRASDAAQSIGFKPEGGFTWQGGMFRGTRGDGYIEHSELFFEVKGTKLFIEVTSNLNAYKIMHNFKDAYKEKRSGRDG